MLVDNTLFVSRKNYISVLWESFSAYLIIIAGITYIYVGYGWESILNFWTGVLFAYVFTDLILLMNYRKHNKGVFITLRSQGLIEIDSNNKISRYNVSDIEEVELNLTIPVYFGGLRMLPGSNFNYGMVFFKDGRSLVITELLDPDLRVTRNLKVESVSKTIRLLNIVRS